jgi:hypothetical protein
MKVNKTKPSTYDKNMAIWNIFPSKSSKLVALFCENFFERSKFGKNLPLKKPLNGM